MKSIINWLFVIAALSLSFVTLSCSKANYGCSKREERKSAKHFNKSVNWCQSEAMRQSLVHFPLKESDSTFVKVETIIDTFVHYDTLVINDTAFITKFINKVVNKVTTREVRVEDSRRIGIIQNQLDNCNLRELDIANELNKSNVNLAKEKSAKQVYKWILIWIIIIIGCIIGIKVVMPKILNRL
jgi:hypothetical protein